MEYQLMYDNFIRSLLYTIPFSIAMIFGIAIAVKIIRQKASKIVWLFLISCALLLISTVATTIGNYVYWQFWEFMKYSQAMAYTFSWIHYNTYISGVLGIAFSLMAMFGGKQREAHDEFL